MKFSVLIVDDEYYICENIRSKIKLLGIKEIGEIRTCCSGEKALSVCKSYKPNIVITDIEMDEINGIQLIQLLKRMLHPVYFIVLSGYDDYQYVRSAFKEGVTDYLLKPILTEQLERILRQQCEYLMNEARGEQESRSSLVAESEKIFDKMIKSITEDEVEKQEENVKNILPEKNFLFLMIGMERNISRYHMDKIVSLVYDQVENELGYPFLCAPRADQKIELLLNSNYISYEAVITFGKKLIQEIFRCESIEVAIGLSGVGELAELLNLHYESENNLCCRITHGYCEIFGKSESDIILEIPDKLKKMTLNLVNNPELIYHSSIWKEIEREIVKLDVSCMKRYFNFLAGLIYSNISSQESDDIEIMFPSFYECTSYKEFIEMLHNKIYEYLSLVENKKNPINVTDSIKEYIDHNFMEKLTLQEIAEKYYISYSYLSKIFHESHGVSFQEYLISKRMSYAEQLLQSQTLSLQEIADAIGYNNVFNFSRAFKKYFGVSPAYYRRK